MARSLAKAQQAAIASGHPVLVAKGDGLYCVEAGSPDVFVKTLPPRVKVTARRKTATT